MVINQITLWLIPFLKNLTLPLPCEARLDGLAKCSATAEAIADLQKVRLDIAFGCMIFGSIMIVSPIQNFLYGFYSTSPLSIIDNNLSAALGA